MTPIILDDEYSYAVHQTGSISTLTVIQAEDDVVARLHAVIKEVTGQAVESHPKPRMGFLP